MTRRPGRTETLMRQAQLIAERSTCDRAHVGAVIVLDGRVVSQGYNGAPAGMDHCDHTCNCPGKWPDRPGNMTDAGPVFHTETCAKTGPCTVAVHAEANAIAFAARHGVATGGAALYTTLTPCLPCAQLIINAGIERVYMLNEYRDDSGLTLLRRSSVGIIPWSFPK